MEAPARTTEEQLAALREEIRRIAGATGCLRRRLRFNGFHVAGLGGLPFGIAVVLKAPPVVVVLLFFGSVILCLGGILAFALGIPIATVHRLLQRHRLRTLLAGLPRQDQAAVLQSLDLREDTAFGDTRKLVAPLLRDLNLPTELTPAGTPEGSGAELSASGEALP